MNDKVTLTISLSNADEVIEKLKEIKKLLDEINSTEVKIEVKS